MEDERKRGSRCGNRGKSGSATVSYPVVPQNLSCRHHERRRPRRGLAANACSARVYTAHRGTACGERMCNATKAVCVSSVIHCGRDRKRPRTSRPTHLPQPRRRAATLGDSTQRPSRERPCNTLNGSSYAGDVSPSQAKENRVMAGVPWNTDDAGGRRKASVDGR